jgi:hypothetical protein|nr:MAG TPA: hypothetical protein [Caudoviricetes sp.]
MPKKIELNSEQQQLFNELKKLSKRANQRIVRLEKEFGKDTWATKKLRDKLATEPLQAWTKTGRVKVNKSMTTTQMKATIKATQQFLNSKTSTKRGIKQVKKTTIKQLAKSLGTDDEDLTNEEAEALYDMLSDDYVTDILKYIPASNFWALIEDAKEAADSQESFISRISDYIEFGNDVDMRNKLIMIYEKYVK